MTPQEESSLAVSGTYHASHEQTYTNGDDVHTMASQLRIKTQECATLERLLQEYLHREIEDRTALNQLFTEMLKQDYGLDQEPEIVEAPASARRILELEATQKAAEARLSYQLLLRYWRFANRVAPPGSLRLALLRGLLSPMRALIKSSAS
jgi:hypothetical protein